MLHIRRHLNRHTCAKQFSAQRQSGGVANVCVIISKFITFNYTLQENHVNCFVQLMYHVVAGAIKDAYVRFGKPLIIHLRYIEVTQAN